MVLAPRFQERLSALSKSSLVGEARGVGLIGALELVAEGERNPETLRRAMNDILEASTLVIEYAAIRDPENWSESPPYSHLNQAQALIAARMGSVRLIDNMRLDNETP